jgi:hypothetical protein
MISVGRSALQPEDTRALRASSARYYRHKDEVRIELLVVSAYLSRFMMLNA